MEPSGKLVYVTKGFPIATFVQDGFQPIPNAPFLDDPTYGLVLQKKLLANGDAILVNRKRKTFYLARRVAKPMQGWWWMGGNRGGINAQFVQGLSSVLEAEMGSGISPDRMVCHFAGDYFWADRSQDPQEMGCHMFGVTLSVDVTDEEIAQIKLDPKEYEEGLIREFTREDLVKENVYAAVLWAYDQVFPPERYQHVVVIVYKEGVSAEAKQDMFNRFQALADDCGGREAGILSWMVKENLDDRKGVGLVEVATYADKDAFLRFKSHPKHQELVNILKGIGDWLVGDYMG